MFAWRRVRDAAVMMSLVFPGDRGRMGLPSKGVRLRSENGAIGRWDWREFCLPEDAATAVHLGHGISVARLRAIFVGYRDSMRLDLRSLVPSRVCSPVAHRHVQPSISCLQQCEPHCCVEAAAIEHLPCHGPFADAEPTGELMVDPGQRILHGVWAFDRNR